MLAIISDIHANLPALEAVLADIDQNSVDAIYCLGDLVGYGPHPIECVDAALEWELCLLSNHEQAALFDTEGFNSIAERSVFKTRVLLEDPSIPGFERRWEFLTNLPRQHAEEGVLYVHGSPRSSLNEYVFPEDAANIRKMDRNFALSPRCCFHGHTHVPGVMLESCQYFRPDEIGFEYVLGDEKVLVNVGSVGQPRSGDWRASYVLFDGERVQFRRVEFDPRDLLHSLR